MGRVRGYQHTRKRVSRARAANERRTWQTSSNLYRHERTATSRYNVAETH